MSYKVSITDLPLNYRILVVGCGGTGSFVAEGLCRLLDADRPLLLVDHDRVESHNLRRQNFLEGDVGKFKSQALAERLSRQYGRAVAYSVCPFDPDMREEAFGGGGLYQRAALGLIIGCVDNAAARIDIARGMQIGSWWLDAGNDRDSGQVLIGDANDIDRLQGAFSKVGMEVCHLPSPAMQAPSILIPPTRQETRQMDCAEAVEADGQSPLINQSMATLVLEFVHRLMKDDLTWMSAYIDLSAGAMHAVPADPVTIARMLSVKVDTLFSKEAQCAIGRRYYMGRR